MAVWKKVIVSGSNAHLNQVTASIFSGSQFSGSFFGNGSGLTGVTATPTFPTTTKTDLATTDKFFVNDDAGNATSGNKQITYANLVLDLAGSGAGTSNLTTTDTGDSLALTSTISGLTSVQATSVTASIFSSSLAAGGTTTFIGTASFAVGSTNATNAANIAVTDTSAGVGPYYITFVDAKSGNETLRVDSSTLTYNATTNAITATASFAGTASWANGAAYSSLTGIPSGIVSGSSLDSPAQGEVRLTTNGVQGSTIDLGLQTTDSPTFAGATISTNALAVNNTNGITTNAATFPIAPSATTINIGTTTNTAINIGTTATTVTIPGNLNVQGATTIISSSNLTVSDKFVFISSGSTSATNEGGIIVSNASNSSGSAFYYEGSNTRWALAPAVGATDSGATPNSFIVSVSGSTADPTGNPTYGGSATGYGNLYVNTTTEDIWIFV